MNCEKTWKCVKNMKICVKPLASLWFCCPVWKAIFRCYVLCLCLWESSLDFPLICISLSCFQYLFWSEGVGRLWWDSSADNGNQNHRIPFKFITFNKYIQTRASVITIVILRAHKHIVTLAAHNVRREGTIFSSNCSWGAGRLSAGQTLCSSTWCRKAWA